MGFPLFFNNNSFLFDRKVQFFIRSSMIYRENCILLKNDGNPTISLQERACMETTHPKKTTYM